MKELKPHTQAEWLIAIAQGKTIQVRKIELDAPWRVPQENILSFLCEADRYEFRIKPETIINGHEVPAPVREPLEYGTPYFTLSIGNASFVEHTWLGHKHDYTWFKLGLIQRTPEAAIAHAEALLSFTRSDK